MLNDKKFAYFDLTIRRLRALVTSTPGGMPLSAAISGIEHHYQDNDSAKTSLGRLVREGRVEGLRLEKGTVFVQEES